MIKKAITTIMLSLLPLIAQDFLKGVKAQDLMLDKTEAPSVKDTLGINDWSKFFFNVANMQISPDNKMNLKVQDDGIWVTDLASGGKTKLDGWGMLPQWSPSGHLIAFIWHGPLSGIFDSRGHQLYGGDELWICKPDGKDKKNLTPGLQCVHFLWSPNEKYIIFDYWNPQCKGESLFALAIVNIETEEIKIIDMGSPYNSFAFCVSSDGQMIAYCKPLKWELMTEWWVTDAEIYIANTDGSGKTQITNTDAVEKMVKWSNDGRSLVVEQYGASPDDCSFPRYVKITLKKK